VKNSTTKTQMLVQSSKPATIKKFPRENERC
jgi:hypothetical protein